VRPHRRPVQQGDMQPLKIKGGTGSTVAPAALL
jgi:hypothetical protein